MRWPFPWPKAWREKAPPKDEEEADEEEEEKPKSLKQQALLFGRDVLLAFLVVAIVMGILFAYTRVWPPMVVVESDSMQHANAESSIGVIDTGDLVLVQTVGSPADIVTYLEARAIGYETYSNFGDVIVFNAPGYPLDATPIIHRAMVYVVPNASGMGFDVPALQGVPAGPSWTGQSASGGAAMNATNLSSLTLLSVRS